MGTICPRCKGSGLGPNACYMCTYHAPYSPPAHHHRAGTGVSGCEDCRGTGWVLTPEKWEEIRQAQEAGRAEAKREVPHAAD